MRLTNTKDQSLNHIRALLIGSSGIGKTTSLTTLPEEGTVILTTERGTLPLQDYNYKAIPFQTWEDLRIIANGFLPDNPCKIDPEIAEALTSAKVIAIDSLSEIAEACKRHILAKRAQDAAKARGTSSKNTEGKEAREDQLTQADWGVYTTKMKNLLSMFTHLPIDLIVTCLEEYKKEQNKYTTNLSGQKLVDACPSFFGFVLNIRSRKDDNGKDYRVWQTYNDGQIEAKDETGRLDPYEPTNWTNLFAKIRDNTGKDTK